MIDLMTIKNVGIDGSTDMAHSHAQNGTKPPMSPRIGAYARISLDAAGEALGVARQQQDNTDQATRRNWEIIESYTDNNLSAYKRSVVRPAFEKLLSDLESGRLDGFVAYDIDRLWRQPADLERVIRIYEDKPTLVFATVQGDIDLSTSQGRTMARIMVALANKSSADTSRRVKRQIAQQAEAGEPHWSRRPYGYTTEKTLDPVEAPIVRQMGEWFIQGFSYREIAWRLNEHGTHTRAGSLWYVGTIRQFMKAERFAALRIQGEKVYDGTWSAIFSKEEWAAIQLEVMMRKGKYADRPKAKKYLLTGLLVCSCGGYLRGMTKRDAPDRPLRRTYQCPTSSETERRMKTCAAMCVDADSLEHYVREQVLDCLDNPDFADVVGVESVDKNRIAELRHEAVDLNARRDQMLDDYIDGTLTKDSLKRAQERLSARRALIDTELDKLQRAQFNVSLNEGETVGEAWIDRPDGWRRALIDLLINDIVISKSSRKPYYEFDGRRTRFDIERAAINWKG
jgi:site-specific DNA recombinase